MRLLDSYIQMNDKQIYLTRNVQRRRNGKGGGENLIHYNNWISFHLMIVYIYFCWCEEKSNNNS